MGGGLCAARSAGPRGRFNAVAPFKDVRWRACAASSPCGGPFILQVLRSTMLGSDSALIDKLLHSSDRARSAISCVSSSLALQALLHSFELSQSSGIRPHRTQYLFHRLRASCSMLTEALTPPFFTGWLQSRSQKNLGLSVEMHAGHLLHTCFSCLTSTNAPFQVLS